MPYRLLIEDRALIDVQSAIDYYEGRQKGLGKKFYSDFLISIKLLKKSPHFQVRYDNVRCLPSKKFPYMIHFVIEDKSVTIYAVISTHLNPEQYWVEEK